MKASRVAGILVAATIAVGACTYTDYTIHEGLPPTGSSGAGGAMSSSSESTSMVSSGSGGAEASSSSGMAMMCDAGVQMGWFTSPIPGSQSYDYNCDGKTEYEYTETLNCSGLGNCDTKTEKWVTGPAPDCGAEAEYGVCEVSVLISCAKKTLGKRPQGCH